MEEPRTYEELKARSAVFDARLASLDVRLTTLEDSRPAYGDDRSSRRKYERWQKKMMALTQQGDEWGREYLAFLQSR